MESLRQSFFVLHVRNAGWPTGRESYGHGVPMVVDGVTPIQGDGHAGHRAKWDRLVSWERTFSEGCRNAPDDEKKYGSTGGQAVTIAQTSSQLESRIQ